MSRERNAEHMTSTAAGLLWRAADAPVRLRLGLAVAAAALGACFAVAAPVVLSRLVDGFADGARSDVLGSGDVLVLVGLYVGALTASRVAELIQTYAFGTGEQRLQQHVNAVVFAHVLRLPLAFHLDRRNGALVQSLTMGLQGARIILTHAVFSVLPILVQMLLISAVVIELFDAQIWAVLIAGLLVYAGVFGLGVGRLDGPTKDVSAAQLEAGGLFNDGLANVEPIKAFSAERELDLRYEEILAETERKWRLFHARRFENGMLATIVFVIVLGAVLIQAAASLAAGAITIGHFVLLNAYVLQVVRPLELAGFAIRDVAQGKVFLDALLQILRTPGERLTAAVETRSAGTVGLRVLEGDRLRAPSVAFENVTFSYGERGPVLRDVSFAIPAGKTLAIVGPSGGGKSSIVRLLLRYYEPDDGRILIDGVSAAEMSIEDTRATMAVVSQDTVLFNATLRRNITFARSNSPTHEVERAVTQARLAGLVARLPEGLETLVGERGLKLSGGERQRVAIARAALKDAPILVFDEATSALDTETERAVWADMVEAARGRTTLIVTHRLAAARFADEILVIEDGRVAEQGVHGALVAAGGVYARLWRRQEREEAAASKAVV